VLHPTASIPLVKRINISMLMLKRNLETELKPKEG